MDTQTETVETEPTDVDTVEATTDVEIPSGEQEAKTPVDRPATGDRKSRKQARLDVEAADKRANEVQQELQRERAEGQRRDRELAEMRGRLEERERRGENVDKQTDTVKKIGELRKQARAQLYFASRAGDEAAAEKAWAEHDRLNDEANDLRDELRDAPRWEKRRGELAQNMPNPAVAATLSGHETQFPWLLSNQEAVSRADAELTRLVQSGHPFNRQTAVMALAWTAKAMGLGGHTPPTSAQRAAYGGVPGGEGAGGGGGPRTIKMGRHEEAMAKAAYPQLEAKDAFKQWAKDIAARTGGDDD